MQHLPTQPPPTLRAHARSALASASTWAAALGLALASVGCTPEPQPLNAEELEAIKSELREELLAELRETAASAPPPATRRPMGDAPPVIRPAGDREDRTRDGDGGTGEPRPRLTPDPIPGDGELDEAAPTPLPPRHVEPVDEAPDDPDDPDAPTTAPADGGEDTGPESGDGDAPREMVRPGAYVYPGTEELALSDVAIGTSIIDRLPQDVRATYDHVPSLMFCYTQFDNRGPEVTVTHVWRRGTRLVSRVELQVGKSPTWRTWSRQRTRDDWKGPWSCEVLDPNGARIGLVEFALGE